MSSYRTCRYALRIKLHSSSLQVTPICYSSTKPGLTYHMHCPDCQNDLVEIPTLEGPQLDVCPGQHGLWLDRGEINLFVENYRALGMTSSSSVATGAIAVHTTTCPRCHEALDEETVLATALFACRACRGWWLPKGS